MLITNYIYQRSAKVFLAFVPFADPYVEKMRYKAVSCMSRSYRPQVPVSYIAQVLGFSNGVLTNEGSDEKESDGLEDCVDWLKAHGACLVADSNGEMQLDAKVLLISSG